MQCRLVVYGYLFTRVDVAKREEKDVSINYLHVTVRLAGMVNVMRPIPAFAAIETPAIVYGADPKPAPLRSAIRLGV